VRWRSHTGAAKAAVAVAGLFAAVFVLRLSFYNPDDGIGLLYSLPVMVAAIRFGPRWGGAAAGCALVLYVVWRVQSHHPLDVVSVAARAAVFLVAGLAVGWFAQQRDAVDRRSRSLFELAAEPMAVVGADGTMLSCNSAFTRLLGRIEGGDVVVTGDALPIGLARGLWAAVGAGDSESARYEQALDTADGELLIQWHWQLGGGRRQTVYVVGHDVTQLREGERARRRIVAEALDGGERTRSRIAGELHDFVLQQLVVAQLQLQAAREGMADGDTPHAERAIGLALTQTRAASAQIQTILAGMRPLVLDHVSLRDALTDGVGELQRDFAVSVRLLYCADADVLDPEERVLAWRLAMETARNAARHAGATGIEVAVDSDEGSLRINISDDGCGLPGAPLVASELPDIFRSSLRLLVERLTASGGSVAVTSDPGSGTSMGYVIPLPSDGDSHGEPTMRFAEPRP
jgi:signal transduction histidine kinase